MHCARSTICPRSLDPFHAVGYFIDWIKTSWTYSTIRNCKGSFQDIETLKAL